MRYFDVDDETSNYHVVSPPLKERPIFENSPPLFSEMKKQLKDNSSRLSLKQLVREDENNSSAHSIKHILLGKFLISGYNKF